MAIVNRTLDPSEQKKVFAVAAEAVATGVTGTLMYVPFPCTLNAIQVAAYGLSGAPTIAVNLSRFITGTGFTSIALVSAQVYPQYGTSGVLASGLSLPANGSTLLNLQANDVLLYVTGVADTAVDMLAAEVVVQPTQDIKTFCGGLA